MHRKGDRIHVDWLAALERHATGVGIRTPEPTEAPTEDKTAERITDTIASAAARFVPKGDAGSADADTWIAVSGGLVRERVKRKDREAYAQAHGVPAGAWSAADAAWQRRMIGDAELQQRYAAALRGG